MRKYIFVLKALAVVAFLVIIKLAIDRLSLDVIAVSPVITGIVAGVIFTIAIIFTGVLADYKESEKIPGDLAASIKSLYRDTGVLVKIDESLALHIREHIMELIDTITANFKSNRWRLREINPVTNKIDEDINTAYDKGLPPPMIVKMRNELASIDRLIYRVEIIMETSFIPAAYHIATVSITAVLLILLFTKMDPYYEGVLLFGSVAFVLISLLMLIQDMDNPFEYGKNSAADVDLKILLKLKDCIENKA
jgi:predicted membrane chloride channel (bestrophin family)